MDDRDGVVPCLSRGSIYRHSAQAGTQEQMTLDIGQTHLLMHGAETGLLSARAIALERGLRFYCGTPCNVGHAGQRYTSSGNCVTCARARARDGSLGRILAKAQAATAAGLRYFSGPTCARCGTRRRYASSPKKCVQCAREAYRKRDAS
jgi:hypothetical protein